MIGELKALANLNGDRLTAVPMDQIKILQKDLKKFRDKNDAQLSDYQKWIFDDLYRFDTIPSHMKSVIIVAVPRPAYARVKFTLGNKEYRAFSGVAAPTDKTQGYIKMAAESGGFEINPETRLPLKRLAVQSGLAQYGQNNIAYVDGLGSAFALLAFSTDIPCESGARQAWRKPVTSATCETCKICLALCPTNAIRADKHHIDSHKCLTRLNQSADDFPDWLPSTAHHSTYYCLMCQARCPMNEGQKIIDVSFDHMETVRLLDGGPYDDVETELKSKIALLGLGKLSTIPRNLRVLFDAMDKGHVPRL